jgi:hypothetical protein
LLSAPPTMDLAMLSTVSTISLRPDQKQLLDVCVEQDLQCTSVCPAGQQKGKFAVVL